MSALAQFACWSGCRVSGSDRSLGPHVSPAPLHRSLQEAGCLLCNQDGSGINGQTQAVIVSTAIEADNPDCVAARQRGLPLVHRSDLLASFVDSHTTIAIAGTSGKSTVTAVCFELLRAAGKDPSLITGAPLTSLTARGFAGNAWKGASDLLIIEADESDGTLVKYAPHLTILLNLSHDHHPVEETCVLLRTLASRSQVCIRNHDCTALDSVPAHMTFGLTPQADVHPETIISVVPSIAFRYREETVHFPLPGTHNLANVLAALAVGEALHCNRRHAVNALEHFAGLQRRFNRLRSTHGVSVIDDFAHNPEKIRAALSTAQALSPRVHALFHPHGYEPLRFMHDELIECFVQTCRSSDTVHLLPVYYAGGTARREIESGDIVHALCERGITAYAPPDRPTCLKHLGEICAKTDLILSMGARDPSLAAFAAEIAQTVVPSRTEQ